MPRLGNRAATLRSPRPGAVGEYASEHLTLVSPVLFAAALAASLWYYRYRKDDLFMLMVGLFGLILVIMALMAYHLAFDEFASLGYLLVLAVLLVLQVAGAAWWLKRVSRRINRGTAATKWQS